MAVTERTESFADLVVDDPREFRVHGSVYADAAVFEAEMERIFERTWVYAGHESELTAAGDYKTILVGTQPVILSRHEDGEVHALYNRCRHRLYSAWTSPSSWRDRMTGWVPTRIVL